MAHRSLFSRRAALRVLAGTGCAAAAHVGGARSVTSAIPTNTLKLLVAGPPLGLLDQWAATIAPVMAGSLPAGMTLERDPVGAADGVTGANRFEAGTAPDGATALLMPGSAALAWLVGDPRAKFDATRWVITLASVTPAVLVSRVPLAAFGAGAPVRVAIPGSGGAALPALLGVELLGARIVPVVGDGAETVIAGSADAALLLGRDILPSVRACAAAGAPPVVALGLPRDSGAPARDPAFPDLPLLSDLVENAARGPLHDAFRVSATIAQLDTAVALPKLTPAAMVAVWRRACSVAAESAELQDEAERLGLRVLATPSATTVAADAAALLNLRRWLAIRFDWTPT